MSSENFFDTGEVIIHYVEFDKSGAPLVMLHGLTGWWGSYEPIIPRLTPMWHVYACDLRGHGQSGWDAAGHYRVPDYAQDIAAFLHEQVRKPAVVLGHSLGALTALGTAVQAPEFVRALVLVDPPLCARNLSVKETSETYKWFRWVYDTVTSAQSLEEVAAGYRTIEPEADEATVKETAERVMYVAAGTVDTVLHDRLLEGFELGSAFQQVKCPTLLLWGDWDQGSTVRKEDAAFVQANLPSATIVKIPNGSHMFLWEQTDVTMQHIETFLQSV
jgi:pimeloyl-ACP methyl ester carboxylesterase